MEIPKGTVRPVKKILGVALGIIGAGKIFGIGYINNIVAGNDIVVGIVLLFAAYLFIVAGRQL